MKKYDVLLTYEIKNREIENLCLVKRELERRGYTVGMCPQYSTFFDIPEHMEANAIVIPAYYRPRAQFYASSHLDKTTKIINLQWEQLTNSVLENDPDALCAIKEWGKEAVHIAWGKNMHDRMVNIYGVPEKNVKVTGHITLDFLRGKLRNYYLSKEVLFRQFAIPDGMRTHLFISSFSLADMHSRVMKNSSAEKREDEMVMDFQKISVQSRQTIVEWFERLLEENPNDIIIYRPHPEERESELLKGLQARQPRFYVISELSVKQWILACDKIYSWFSSSIAEIYAAGKGCAVIRPLPLSKDSDLSIYEDADIISDYEGLAREFVSDGQCYSIKKEKLGEYYDIDLDRYSYERVCDVIEEVLNDDYYLLDPPKTNPLLGGFINFERIKNHIKCFIARSRIFGMIQEKDLFAHSSLREALDDVIYVRDKLKKNYTSEEEISRIISRIDAALNNE